MSVGLGREILNGTGQPLRGTPPAGAESLLKACSVILFIKVPTKRFVYPVAAVLDKAKYDDAFPYPVDDTVAGLMAEVNLALTKNAGETDAQWKARRLCSFSQILQVPLLSTRHLV